MMKNRVPEIRFQEFSEEWKEKRLGEICDNISSGKSKNEENGLYLLYGSTGVIGKTKSFTHNGTYILIARVGANAGKINIISDKFSVTDNTLIIDLNNITNIQYIFYFLKNKNLNNLVFGSGQPLITGKQLKQLKIYRPTLQEQQKIADILSSLDNLIEAHNKKLELLKQHKKGLMQKLFPKDGAKVPELRFKEFSGEWEEKRLGDNNIIEFFNGKAHEKDIDINGKYIVINSKFISTNGKVQKFSNKAYLKANKNEITIVMSDIPNGKAIAKCFYIDKDDKYTINQRIGLLKPKNIHSKFLFFILNRNKFYLSFDDGVKQTNLKKDDILSCPLKLPTPQEQQKIADSLSSLDNLIEAQSKKIEKLKEHKKGLMQKMFVREDLENE